MRSKKKNEPLTEVLRQLPPLMAQQQFILLTLLSSAPVFHYLWRNISRVIIKICQRNMLKLSGSVDCFFVRGNAAEMLPKIIHSVIGLKDRNNFFQQHSFGNLVDKCRSRIGVFTASFFKFNNANFKSNENVA